jgi:hypothetical protein
MGWSCSVKASHMMQLVSEKYVEQTGNSNTYIKDGVKYFFENSRKEHSDGSITGKIFKFVSENECIPVGRFKILPDGKVDSWAAFPLKYRDYHIQFDKLKRKIFGEGSFALVDNTDDQKEYEKILKYIMREIELGIYNNHKQLEYGIS